MTEDLDRRTVELDRAHVFHSWSAQGALAPMVVAGGLGSRVWNHAGREWLDFSSQLVNVNIGHQHPRLVAAIQEQAQILTTISPPTANLARGEAARRITDLAPDGFNKVFFTNGGADANENAIRMARQFTGRDKVVSTYRSYHGNTGSAVVATGDWRRVPNEFARGHVHVFGPYLYRSEFWATTPEEESERALHHLTRVVESEGPASIAAILLETIPGTAGVLMPPPGYLAGVRALADKHGIMLILDEVMAGFGRTGHWFAFDAYDVRARPDHLRQGRQLRLRPGRRRGHQRPDRRPLRRDRLPRRPDLHRPPAGDGLDRGLDRHHGRGGDRRQRGADRPRRARSWSRRAGRQARPDRRGPRRGRLLGARAGRRSRHPRNPWRRP